MEIQINELQGLIDTWELRARALKHSANTIQSEKLINDMKYLADGYEHCALELRNFLNKHEDTTITIDPEEPLTDQITE